MCLWVRVKKKKKKTFKVSVSDEHRIKLVTQWRRVEEEIQKWEHEVSDSSHMIAVTVDAAHVVLFVIQREPNTDGSLD